MKERRKRGETPFYINSRGARVHEISGTRVGGTLRGGDEEQNDRFAVSTSHLLFRKNAFASRVTHVTTAATCTRSCARTRIDHSVYETHAYVTCFPVQRTVTTWTPLHPSILRIIELKKRNCRLLGETGWPRFLSRWTNFQIEENIIILNQNVLRIEFITMIIVYRKMVCCNYAVAFVAQRGWYNNNGWIITVIVYLE